MAFLLIKRTLNINITIYLSCSKSLSEKGLRIPGMSATCFNKLNYLFSYPSTFIDQQFEYFFSKYIAPWSFIPYIFAKDQFNAIHQDLSEHMTPRQSQVAFSAAKADLDNDQTDYEHATTTVTKISSSSSSLSPSNKLFIHYKYEKRFRSFRRDIHQIHNRVIPRHLALDLRLIVGTYNRSNAQNELIRKKPKQWLLKDQTSRNKRKYLNFLGKFNTI